MNAMTPSEKRSAKATERRDRQIGLGLRGEPDPRPVSPIILFTGFSDSGPCEPGSPSAFCPHCGCGGRYVWSFICQDGSRRGAMRGCVKLFAATKLAGDQSASLERFRKDTEDFNSGDRKYPPASWDRDIHMATWNLNRGIIGIDEAKSLIGDALRARAAFIASRSRRGR